MKMDLDKLSKKLENANMNLADYKLSIMNKAMGIKESGTWWERWQIHVLIFTIFSVMCFFLWFKGYTIAFRVTMFVFVLLFYKTIRSALKTK